MLAAVLFAEFVQTLVDSLDNIHNTHNIHKMTRPGSWSQVIQVYRLLYSCCFYLLIPSVLLRLLYRSVKEPLYRSAINERFGCYHKKTGQSVIWIHAVSAGETIAAVPLIKRLVARGYPCLVTHMTPTGRQRVEVMLAAEIAAGTVEYCYAPYDLPGSVRRFLDQNAPLGLFTIDTELWPNTIAACHERGIATMLVNGRLSARSAAGYARLAGLTLPMLKSIDVLAVQTIQHRDRFVSLGVDEARIHVTGSVKFDGQFSDDHASKTSQFKTLIGPRPVLLGASTHEGEESALVHAFCQLRSRVDNALLILVPRHTHRSSRVIDICTDAGLALKTFSSVAGATPVATPLSQLDAAEDVMLIDVMGELENIYPVAKVAFVGGSLVPVGGHNLLEAVRAGVPLIMGPHLDNIDDIAAQFIQARAMRVAATEDELVDHILELFNSNEICEAQVLAANRILEENRGALDRVEQKIYTLISPT